MRSGVSINFGREINYFSEDLHRKQTPYHELAIICVKKIERVPCQNNILQEHFLKARKIFTLQKASMLPMPRRGKVVAVDRKCQD